MSAGWIDYWCNAFTPDRLALWEAALEAQGTPLKIRRGADDSFAEPAAMLARMDELGVATLVLPSAEIPERAGPTDYAAFTTPAEEISKLSTEHPGRFAGLVTLDPTAGRRGRRRATDLLADSAFVGLQIHTHSWDRPFDHSDFYPYYAIASDHGVPVVMQAGASGGREPSACGRPIGIDRPALAFPEVDFVLSHTGWPWTDEALAMASKHPNVFLGTGAWPPHRWGPDLVRFLAGQGAGKTLLGTSFPVVGHRHALERLAQLELSDTTRDALLSGAARRVFTRLAHEENRA